MLEFHTLDDNHTWVMAPPRKNILTLKWVYKRKYRPNDIVDRHKARLVIRDFNQIQDKDHNFTFPL